MKNTVSTFKEQKVKGDKITMLTAYDYSTAKLMDQSGINGILVWRFSWHGYARIRKYFAGNNGRYDSPYKSSYKRCQRCLSSWRYAVYVISSFN